MRKIGGLRGPVRRVPLSVSVLNQLRVKLIQFHFKLIELNPYNMFKNAHFHI